MTVEISSEQQVKGIKVKKFSEAGLIRKEMI